MSTVPPADPQNPILPPQHTPRCQESKPSGGGVLRVFLACGALAVAPLKLCSKAGVASHGAVPWFRGGAHAAEALPAIKGNARAIPDASQIVRDPSWPVLRAAARAGQAVTRSHGGGDQDDSVAGEGSSVPPIPAH